MKNFRKMNDICIIDFKESMLGYDINKWCMDHQDDPFSMEIYRVYMSKNSVKPINVNAYYFVEKSDMLEGRTVILRRDKSKKPKPKITIYKIPLDVQKGKEGYITIASKKQPADIIKSITSKGKRRKINSEALKLLMDCYIPSTRGLGKYYKDFPDNKIFIIIDSYVEELQGGMTNESGIRPARDIQHDTRNGDNNHKYRTEKGYRRTTTDRTRVYNRDKFSRQ